MSVESVTQAVSNLALEFGDDDAREGAMVRKSSTSPFLAHQNLISPYNINAERY